MALPFLSESDESLKNRYSKALEKPWALNHKKLKEDRPGLHRECVFDFENGIRLIISRDSEHNSYIHLSSSFDPGKFNPPHGTNPQQFFFMETIRNFKKISRTSLNIDYIPHQISDGGIPHWIFPITQTND